MMKKFLSILTFALLIIVGVRCSDDDDDNKGNVTQDVPKHYTITFVTYWENEPKHSVEFKEGDNIRFESLVRSGFEFKGWSDTENGNPINTSNVKATSDKTYYALWAKTYKVLFYVDDVIDATWTIEEGKPFDISNIKPQKSERKNSVFLGWSESQNSDNLVSSITIEKDSTSLYAVWEKVVFNISFDLCGGAGTNIPSPIEVKKGEYLYLNMLPLQNGFSYGVYSFGGWSKTKNGNIIDESFKPEDDMVLYAVWKNNGNVKPKTDDKYFSVCFKYNDGTDNKEIKSIESGKSLTNTDFPIVTRDKYILKGWAESSYGEPINSITILYDVTLYAIWDRIKPKIRNYHPIHD